MIVGNGDIASVLPDRDDMLFFASGVSNSQETDEEEYRREIKLLMDQSKFNHLIYFSSLSIFTNRGRYARHKVEMEMIAKIGFRNYTIIRIGNIDWGKNPHTLINYLKKRIKKGLPYEVRDEYRYIVGKEEFLHWLSLIPNDLDCEMNIPGRMMKVQEIVDAIKAGKL